MAGINSSATSSSSIGLLPADLKLSNLPSDQLGQIMQFLDPAECFRGLALVSRVLRKAVIAQYEQQLKWTTKWGTPQASLDSFHSFVAKHGQQLSSLEVVYDSRATSSRASPLLERRRMRRRYVGESQDQPHSDSESEQLGRSFKTPSGQSSLVLSPLPCSNLSSLNLELLQLQLCASSGKPGVLDHLTALTSLRLRQCSFENSIMLEFPLAVTSLKSLTLSNISSLLTSPCWSALTGLSSLSVSRGILQPSNLSSLPQLQELSLRAVQLLPSARGASAASSSSSDSSSNSNSRTGGGLALLAAVATLTKLTSLSVMNTTGDWPAPSAPQYSALTASSRLWRLCIRDRERSAWHRHSDPTIPTGVLEHAGSLPAGRCLPELTSWDSLHFGGAMKLPALGRLVSLSPNIRELSVEVSADTDLTVLQPLTALVSLTVAGCLDFEPPCRAIQSVTALTQLTYLQIIHDVNLRYYVGQEQKAQLSRQMLGALKQLEHCDINVRNNRRRTRGENFLNSNRAEAARASNLVGVVLATLPDQNFWYSSTLRLAVR